MSSINMEVEIPAHYKDVTVSVQEVIHALGNDVGADSIRGWLAFLNRHYGVFSRTPDAIIAEMTPGQRETIARAFREQAQRFEKGGES